MNERDSALILRPHHLLCIQKFTGHGYDAAFTAHMTALCEMLRSAPDTQVRLVSGADTLCAACPNCRGGICDAQEKVAALDAALLAKGGLPDSPQAWHLFAEAAGRNILATDLFDKICADCQWYGLCKATGGIINGTKKATDPHT
ncbi:MAG: DUF1284 domain-containing protein [Oscillospiraceae bacterium]|nr:DUF1284 domain-containing protein [Oscillospiraceae bacterium]